MAELLGEGVEWELDSLRRACRSAWEAAEKARLALSRHESNHFCDRTDFVPTDLERLRYS